MIEREIKLRFESPAAARAAVTRLGAAPHAARRLQDDAILDDEEGRLLHRGCALRVRRETFSDRRAAYLTFKGPVTPGAMKIREELETSVADGETMLGVLRAIGFTPRFRYQKYREEFRLGTLIVAIDETPVGVFVELEGQEADITAAAATLGRSPGDYVLASYRTLFLEHRRTHGLAATDMLFPTS